jgi:hypothetical protein
MTKLTPWYIGQARRSFVFWMTLPIQFSETFWNTWAEVYRK